MRHTSDVKGYALDLRKDTSKQMVEILRNPKEATVLKQFFYGLTKDFCEELGISRKLFLHSAQVAGFGLSKVTKNPYLKEMAEIWKPMGISGGAAVLLNHAYDLSQVSGSLYGCTSAIFHAPKIGMVHCRTLDWPVPALGKATRLFRFTGGKHEFVVVSFLGSSGVLSGMVPGGYSLTLNWAPPSGFKPSAIGPMFLLRQTLETCRTYDEAVSKILSTPTMTGCFVSVCGTKEGEACVIERTPYNSAMRVSGKTGVLVHANDFRIPEFRHFNKGVGEEREWAKELYESSRARVANLTDAVKEVRSSDSLEDVAACLDCDEVLNEDSHQQMAFCPATGQVLVWRSY